MYGQSLNEQINQDDFLSSHFDQDYVLSLFAVFFVSVVVSSFESHPKSHTSIKNMSNSKCILFFDCSDIHTEAVQAALAKHKEEKMALPMPTKRRSTYVQSPIETRTPPGRTEEGQIDL